MTREKNSDNDALLREALRMIRQMGYRKPFDRVYRSERHPCGARCRDGHPCQAPAMLDQETGCYVRNGRCRIHGGRSTGPRTLEGKRRIAEANRRRAQQRHRRSQDCRNSRTHASERRQSMPSRDHQ